MSIKDDVIKMQNVFNKIGLEEEEEESPITINSKGNFNVIPKMTLKEALQKLVKYAALLEEEKIEISNKD